MDRPPFSLRPSPWVLLALAAMLLVFVGIASQHSGSRLILIVLGWIAVVFAGVAVALRRKT